MEPKANSNNIDRFLVAKNVRRSRLSEGLSQTELARRSNVNLASVYRVEKGEPTHRRTLEKIALGLAILFEDLLIEKTTLGTDRAFAVHRASEAKWFATEDRRQRLPLDDHEALQSPSERRRIGQLGFVPLFMCPPLIIPENGPGLVLLESFEIVPGPFNAEFYEDGALLALKGRAAGTICGEPFELEEGDWIAFKNANLQTFGVAPSHQSVTLLWIGATRLK